MGRVGDLGLSGDLAAPAPGSGSESGSGAVEESSGAEADDGLSSYAQPLVDAGAAFIASLGDLVQVEKNGESLKPVVSAHARQLIYERVRLLLESAQIALVRHQYALYEDRLTATRGWVEQAFDMSSDKTVEWLEDLDAVRTALPDGTLPDVSGSLAMVREQTRSQ